MSMEGDRENPRFMTPDKRRQPRPCQGVKGNNPTIYQLGNTLSRKVVRNVHPVAAAFKEARLSSGLSQEIVAERSGYDLSTISRFERGLRSVNIVTLADLCGAFGMVLTVQSASISNREEKS